LTESINNGKILFAVILNKKDIIMSRFYSQKRISRRGSSEKGRALMHIGALAVIGIIQVFAYIWRFIAIFFVWVMYKPIYFSARFVFYNIFIKLYVAQRTLFKRLGWNNFGKQFISFVFHQRFVHALVALITVVLLFFNLIPSTKANNLSESAEKTILAGLIEQEYDTTGEEEELIVETFDSEAEISPAQQSYLDNLGAFKAPVRVSLEEDEEAEELLPTIQGGTAMVKPEIAATNITEREREGIVLHKVAMGDSVSTIAQSYGVSVNTILWENNLSAYSIIRAGDELAILPMSGIAHKVASGDNLNKLADKYGVEKDKIAAANKIDIIDSLKIGQKIIIPGGKKVAYAVHEPKAYSGLKAIKDIVKAPSAKPVAGNKMNWPTVGTRITQYYSWRHYAIDIANKTGTPLFAADAGTVELAGWGKGYGNQIVIDHGGGKKTRYAHCSKFYVKKGDVVSKGQTIAAMGSTGWSTGPHIHFELIINGKKQNPLDYIR